jgi:hypothetical protein
MGRSGLKELGIKGLMTGEDDPVNAHNSLPLFDLYL